MSAKKKKASPRKRASYHHGNLPKALIAAALRLIAKSGLESVTIRRVAKLAGVSPGAPFRHFSSRKALMTAVAEEAMLQFRAEIAASLSENLEGDPLTRFRAVGTAFLRWAAHYPALFITISSRKHIDFDSSEVLVRNNEEIKKQVNTIIVDAQNRGLMRKENPAAIQLTGRAMIYGLARMYVDGHFPSWDLNEADIEAIGNRMVSTILAGLSP